MARPLPRWFISITNIQLIYSFNLRRMIATRLRQAAPFVVTTFFNGHAAGLITGQSQI
jgi:hypothetical protein